MGHNTKSHFNTINNTSPSPTPKEILLYNFQNETAMLYMNKLYEKLNFIMCPSCFRTIDMNTGERWRPEFFNDFISNEQCNCNDN